jgi:hypothetical protein
MLSKDKSHLVSLKVHTQCNISFSCSKSPRRHCRIGSVEIQNDSRINTHGYHITDNTQAIFYHGCVHAGLLCFLRQLTLNRGHNHRLSLCFMHRMRPWCGGLAQTTQSTGVRDRSRIANT